MDKLNIRHYFFVAVAGVFCWLNTSVASAQATDVDCVRCIEVGELAYGAVGWYEVSFGFQRHMNQQAADSSNAIAAVTALVARVATLEATVATLEADSYASPTADPDHSPGTFHPKQCCSCLLRHLELDRI